MLRIKIRTIRVWKNMQKYIRKQGNIHWDKIASYKKPKTQNPMQ